MTFTPGIVASGPPIVAIAPPAVLGTFDFVNHVYDWGGSSLTVGQVTDQTGWVGASGMVIPAFAGAGAQILYAATQTFLAACQFTAVIEVEILNANQALILTIANSGEAFYIEFEVFGTTEWDLIDSDGGPARSAFPTATNGVSVGVHKAAFTRTDTLSAVAVDGGPAYSDTTTVTLPVGGFPMVDFCLGGFVDYTDDTIRIRSVAFYDAQPAGLLPSMSV